MPYKQQLLQEERAYHNPPLHPSQEMNLITSPRILINRMLGPIPERQLHSLLLHVNKARLLNTSSHLVKDVGWVARRFGNWCHQVLEPEDWSVGGSGTVVALHTDGVFELLEPAAWFEVVVGALVELVPLLEGEGAEKLTAVDQIEGYFEGEVSRHIIHWITSQFSF